MLNPEEEVIAKPDDSAEFAALAFKVMTDPYVGKLTFFRVIRYFNIRFLH